MTKRMMMNEQEIINFKLELARAWIQNGHEDLARELVKSIIVKAEGQNE
jgi:Tfp pilus assembly protein FimV